jgi:hypothetical protein
MKKLIKIFVFIFILFLVLIAIRAVVGGRPTSRTVVIQEQSVAKPKATVELNKTFEFSAAKVGQKGTQKIKFTIASAELKDEIKVKSVPRKSDKESLFFVVRLEIDNPTSDKLSLAPSDLIRLVVGADKKFAPDFHNATIIIDPISIRKDLVSFVIPSDQKTFRLSVGELEGKKEIIEINF